MNIHEQIAHAEAQLKQAREQREVEHLRIILRKLNHRLQQEDKRHGEI